MYQLAVLWRRISNNLKGIRDFSAQPQTDPLQTWSPMSFLDPWSNQTHINTPQKPNKAQKHNPSLNRNKAETNNTCNRPNLVTCNNNRNRFLHPVSTAPIPLKGQILTVLILFTIWVPPCPFKSPMITKNAIVFMIAPAVIQSTNHLVRVFFMLNFGSFFWGCPTLTSASWEGCISRSLRRPRLGPLGAG